MRINFRALNKGIVNSDFFSIFLSDFSDFLALFLSGWRSTGIVGAEKNARSSEIRLGFGFC